MCACEREREREYDRSFPHRRFGNSRVQITSYRTNRLFAFAKGRTICSEASWGKECPLLFHQLCTLISRTCNLFASHNILLHFSNILYRVMENSTNDIIIHYQISKYLWQIDILAKSQTMHRQFIDYRSIYFAQWLCAVRWISVLLMDFPWFCCAIVCTHALLLAMCIRTV